MSVISQTVQAAKLAVWRAINKWYSKEAASNFYLSERMLMHTIEEVYNDKYGHTTNFQDLEAVHACVRDHYYGSVVFYRDELPLQSVMCGEYTTHDGKLVLVISKDSYPEVTDFNATNTRMYMRVGGLLTPLWVELNVTAARDLIYCDSKGNIYNKYPIYTLSDTDQITYVLHTVFSELQTHALTINSLYVHRFNQILNLLQFRHINSFKHSFGWNAHNGWGDSLYVEHVETVDGNQALAFSCVNYPNAINYNDALCTVVEAVFADNSLVWRNSCGKSLKEYDHDE